MPTVAGVKIKAKTRKVRNPLYMDEKYTGSEPEWSEDASKLTDQEFDRALRKSFNFYNYYHTQKDTKKFVEDWVRKSGVFTAEQIKKFEKASDRSVPMTACSLAMAIRAGMPPRERHIQFLKDSVLKAISGDIEVSATGKEEKPVVPATPSAVAMRPSIQDRLNERTIELIGELEGHFDDVFMKKESSFKPYDFLMANKVVQGQLSKYIDAFSARKQELIDAQNKKDLQLVEGYKNLKAVDFKRLIAWIDALFNAIEEYRGVKQATKKARIKKAPSKEKLVAKLKYAKEFKELKLVSVSPSQIIGSSELWIYNTKSRKLGKYVAAAFKELTVKGASIEGFDTDKSVCKTIRKPEEKLKEFFKAGKVQLRKFLEDIKATETKLNGRINADIVLLKTA